MLCYKVIARRIPLEFMDEIQSVGKQRAKLKDEDRNGKRVTLKKRLCR